MNITQLDKNFGGYSENNQSNPLRYRILFHDGENLVCQTNEFKCKDYFNDVVGWYRNTKGYIYGMDTRQLHLNSDGIYVLFTHTTKVFETLVESVVNPKLKADVGVEIQRQDLPECVYFIPREVFQNTKTTGWLFWLIRQCNVAKLRTLEEMVYQPVVSSSTEHMMNAKPAMLEAFLKPGGFLPHNSLLKYGWYYTDIYNSEKESGQNMSHIHNAGPLTWFGAEVLFIKKSEEVSNAL